MKTTIQSQLEDALNKGKRVFVYDHADIALLTMLCDELEKADADNAEVWHGIDGMQDREHLRRLTQEQMQEVMQLYRLYDFSDKVVVISDSGQYGTLFNYVACGILTETEMVAALLQD